MPRRDMADLMGQHRRELILVVEMGQHSARHVNVPSRERHGIDDRAVQYLKGDRSFAKFRFGFGSAQMTPRQNSLANLVDVTLKLSVAIDAESSGDFLTGLFADFDFFFPAESHIPFLSGRRDDARRAAKIGDSGEQQKERPQ